MRQELIRCYYRRNLEHREQAGCDESGVGSIPAGGPIVDEFFSTVPG